MSETKHTAPREGRYVAEIIASHNPFLPLVTESGQAPLLSRASIPTDVVPARRVPGEPGPVAPLPEPPAPQPSEPPDHPTSGPPTEPTVQPEPRPALVLTGVSISERGVRVLLEQAGGGAGRWVGVPGNAAGWRIVSATLESATLTRGGDTFVLELGGASQGSGSAGATGAATTETSSPTEDAMSDVQSGSGRPRDREKESHKAVDVRSINDAIMLFEQDNGVPPARIEQLYPYVSAIPHDPYSGEPYYLRDGALAGPGDVQSFRY